MNLIDAIYTRQSVDRADSISVESQAEFCKREVVDADVKIYTDKGYSGKNIDRPAFQELLADIEKGKIRRVIVYRLDRGSAWTLPISLRYSRGTMWTLSAQWRNLIPEPLLVKQC